MIRSNRTAASFLSAGYALLILCLFAPMGYGQSVDATKWLSGSVDLNQGWRTQAGDDPTWAQTKFDDSGWKTAELDDLGAARLEWRWFRLHVRLAPDHPHADLLIVGGEGVYSLYVNGRAMEDVGLWSSLRLRRPVESVIPLPDDGSEYTLALRTRATPMYTLWHLPLFLTAAVGTEDAIENERAAYESQRLYAAIPSIAINLLMFLAGLCVLALYANQRTRAEYLWLGLYLLLLGVSNGLLYSSTAGIMALVWNNLLADPLIYVFTIMQIEFTFSFVGRRVERVGWTYEALLLIGPVISYTVTLGWLPNASYVLVEALMILPAALLLPVLLFVWRRRGTAKRAG